MLQIVIPEQDGWDEAKEEFFHVNEQTLQLEHSLVSLSKWESKWCKAFLTTKTKTVEEMIDYIRCMTLTKNVEPYVYEFLTEENIHDVDNYIHAPMTATYFSDLEPNSPSREIITSELIYYWMVALNIPFECQKWHLNRLLTLVKVCNIKNKPPKKRGTKATMSRYAAINMARRQQMNSNG